MDGTRQFIIAFASVQRKNYKILIDLQPQPKIGAACEYVCMCAWRKKWQN